MATDKNTNNTVTGFTEAFLSKLKEQSFVILIMLGVIYYQHRLMEERVAFWQSQYEKKDSEINSIVKEEKSVLMERIVYLQEQRDKYVERSLEEEEKEN
jgi:hypothetical protein